MGKKYQQTEEAKELFKSPLLAYIQSVVSENPRHVFTKEELIETSQLSDRAVRDQMERIANFYPIISFSDRKGYTYGHFKGNESNQDLALLFDDVNHAIHEINSRVECLNARLKPLIALQEVLKAKIAERMPKEDL